MNYALSIIPYLSPTRRFAVATSHPEAELDLLSLPR